MLWQVDRMFDWQPVKDAPIRDSFAAQKDYVNLEFEKRLQQSTLNLNEQGLNVALYWANPDPRKYVNIVPTSAITGEGEHPGGPPQTAVLGPCHCTPEAAH